VLEIERSAIEAAFDCAPDQVAAAARLILGRAPSDVVTTGVGKSGHIARKLASTLSSVGTRSHFYLTSEMFHGDLGVIDKTGVVIVISKSGSGADIAQLVDFCHHRGVGLVGIIADKRSPIVPKLDVFIDASIQQEADPEAFVPTASTTLALALSDALAVCLMEARGFTSKDFAQFHPSGALGAKLNRTVAEIMTGPDDIPQLRPDQSARDLAIEMSRHPTGLAVVLSNQETLIGVVSDGDLRRALTLLTDLSNTPVGELMTSAPSTIGPDSLVIHALDIMESHQPRAISALPVVSGGRILGVVTIHQLYREIH